MKRLLLFILVVFSTLRICEAQDTIFTFSKHYILAKNIDNTGNSYMYQNFNDTADNWHNIWRIDVNRIHYHSGGMVIVNTYDKTKYNHYEPPVDSALFLANLKAHKTRDSVINSRKVFSITTDIAQYALSQPNIGLEFKLARPLFIGINGALIIPSPLFGVNPFANGQFTNPGLVYTGYALRFYIKLYMHEKTKRYWCLQGVYKSLSCNNVNEQDEYSDDDDDIWYNNYTLSEHVTTFGVDVFHGNEIIGNENRFVLDLFYGFGLHFRNRSYSITNQSLSGGGFYYPQADPYQPTVYNGNYSVLLIVPTPEVGLRIGFNYLKKK